MATLTYNLKNGLQFSTVEHLDGYIRGLELVRQNFVCTPANGDSAPIFAEWLDDAHAAKSDGPSSDEPVHAQEAEKAA